MVRFQPHLLPEQRFGITQQLPQEQDKDALFRPLAATNPPQQIVDRAVTGDGSLGVNAAGPGFGHIKVIEAG